MNDDISNNNKSDKTKSNVKHKYLVEIVGTFILVYAIASAATVYSDSGHRSNWNRISTFTGINGNNICYCI
jgi:glycerol uptake facilitator-like aquaporin